MNAFVEEGTTSTFAANLVAIGTLVGILVTAILQLRAGWKQDKDKKDIVAMVGAVDTKVAQVAIHTDGMQAAYAKLIDDYATLKEKGRGEDEARQLVHDQQSAVEAGVKARMEGALEEKKRQEQKP